METSIIAILVSLISVGVACLSFGWNIYRDIGLKPRLLVSFDVVFLNVLNENLKYLSISGTNLGLVPTRVNGIALKESSIWKKLKSGGVYPDFENPLSHKLPMKLEAGDEIQLFLSCNVDCFLKEPWTHVGLQTSFGKTYWVKPRDVNRARQLWLKDFGNNRTQPPHIRS